MKTIFVSALCVLLAACAGQKLAGNPRSVIVQAGAAQPDEAQRVADEHCKQYGRYAVLAGKPSLVNWAFDCVN